MSTTAVDVSIQDLERRGSGMMRPVRDALAVTGRNLIGYRRVPQLLVFSTIQPVVFVLLFRYVFGGAVNIPNYVDYLIPGVFVQTVVFGSMTTAVGLATDLKSGLLERFRSLPMARSAVLAGRTGADRHVPGDRLRSLRRRGGATSGPTRRNRDQRAEIGGERWRLTAS